MTRTFEKVIKKHFRGKKEKEIIKEIEGPTPRKLYKVEFYIKATKEEQEETRRINSTVDPNYRYFTNLDSADYRNSPSSTPGELEVMLDSIDYIKKRYKEKKKRFNINFHIFGYGVNTICGARLDLDIDEEDIKEVRSFLDGARIASVLYRMKIVEAS